VGDNVWFKYEQGEGEQSGAYPKHFAGRKEYEQTEQKTQNGRGHPRAKDDSIGFRFAAVAEDKIAPIEIGLVFE
jgi:hypothetical protein